MREALIPQFSPCHGLIYQSLSSLLATITKHGLIYQAPFFRDHFEFFPSMPRLEKERGHCLKNVRSTEPTWLETMSTNHASYVWVKSIIQPYAPHAVPSHGRPEKGEPLRSKHSCGEIFGSPRPNARSGPFQRGDGEPLCSLDARILSAGPVGKVTMTQLPPEPPFSEPLNHTGFPSCP